jgi:hypothetical protein
MLQPAAWISSEAWPARAMRRPPVRGGGVSVAMMVMGGAQRWAVLFRRQRQMSARLRSVVGP